MGEFPFIPPHSVVGRTLGNVLNRWLARHMNVNCRTDAIDQPIEVPASRVSTKDGPLQEIEPALSFGGEIYVLNRHYSVQLEKVIVWLEGREANPQALIPTRMEEKIVFHGGGFYRVDLEVSNDYEYLICIKIARL